MIFSRIVPACALAMLTVQPCLAAEIPDEGGPGERRSSAFAGASLRLPLGGTRGREKPTARLQLGFAHDYRNAAGAPLRTYRSSLLEVDAASGGRFLIAGQDARQTGDRLHMKGKATTWLIVGGVVVVAIVILAAVAGAQPTPGPHEGAFD